MYQWKWMKVDKPGLWAWGGNDRSLPPEHCFPQYWKEACGDFGWRCYLSPIPDIAQPEPELRLPEGWEDRSIAGKIGWRARANSLRAPELVIEIWHPDKATAIRAAQAAVDVLAEPSE